MSEVQPRYFDVATDGSDMAELICDGVMQPLADQLAHGSFMDSADISRVNQESSMMFTDDKIIVLEFSAWKVFTDAADSIPMYNASITFVRSRTPDEHWPDMGFMDDTDDDEDEEGPIAVFIDDDDEWDDEDLPKGFDMCYVKEAWDFVIDSEAYKTRKDIRYEYYFGDSIIDLVDIGGCLGSVMLSEKIGEDTLLNVYDASFATSYSELDIALIEAICSFDFVRARAFLTQCGAFDAPETPDQQA